MSRPTSNESSMRRNMVNVRLTDSELERLTSVAAADENTSVFLRRIISEQPAKGPEKTA